ncbi:3-octaprenyl-4-hydroxybenzoate carboxy-lyase [Streptomyces griseoloalbus]
MARWAGRRNASSCSSKIIVPDIVDYHLPEAGGFHNCAIVSIDKKYPKHAQKVMHAVWGAHMMSLTKLIVVVDSDCDVHDLHEVAWRALGNTDYARDLSVVEGTVDHLDHASYQQFWGGKAGIDATRKWPEDPGASGTPYAAAVLRALLAAGEHG